MTRRAGRWTNDTPKRRFYYAQEIYGPQADR